MNEFTIKCNKASAIFTSRQTVKDTSNSLPLVHWLLRYNGTQLPYTLVRNLRKTAVTSGITDSVLYENQGTQYGRQVGLQQAVVTAATKSTH